MPQAYCDPQHRGTCPALQAIPPPIAGLLGVTNSGAGPARELKLGAGKRKKLVATTYRLAGFGGKLLDVHVDFPLFQRMSLPVWSKTGLQPLFRSQRMQMCF